MTTKAATKVATTAHEAERLAAAAAEAVAKADEARARAEAAAKRAEERRQVEITAIRRRRLDAFDDAALVAEERKARQRFGEAVLANDGAVPAFIDWQVAASRRYLLAVEARQAQAVLEPEAAPLPVGGPPGAIFAEEVQRVIDRAVANAVADFEDTRQAELDAAGR